MSSDNDDIIAGVTKGTISLGIDKIKELVAKFCDRRLIFIQDQETINLVKEQLKSGEWSLCNQYLKNSELKLLVQMGLTLRKLNYNKDESALLNLRTKIFNRYGKKSLHIAQFVQSNILSSFIGSIADRSISLKDMIEKVESLLNNIDKQTIFVQKNDKNEEIIDEIHTRLKANVPDVFIIFTSKSAIIKGLDIKRAIERKIKDYSVEVLQEKDRLLIFLFKEEMTYDLE